MEAASRVGRIGSGNPVAGLGSREELSGADRDMRVRGGRRAGDLRVRLARRASAVVGGLQLGGGRACVPGVAQVPELVEQGAVLGKHQQQRQHPGDGQPTTHHDGR